jgi:mono/diheme cytochrome c family protein
MRHELLAAGLLLFATGCDFWYNDVPSPDTALNLVPWFDGMITSPAVHPYQRADIPRNSVPGTVPITGGEADWSAEWAVANTTTADKLINPYAGQPATARGDTLYQTYCAVCHGSTGNGDGPVGPRVAALPLTTPRAIAWSDGYLYSIIRYGRGIMSKDGDRVRGQTRWEVVNYVRQLQAAAQAQAGPAAPQPGGAK